MHALSVKTMHLLIEVDQQILQLERAIKGLKMYRDACQRLEELNFTDTEKDNKHQTSKNHYSNIIQKSPVEDWMCLNAKYGKTDIDNWSQFVIRDNLKAKLYKGKVSDLDNAEKFLNEAIESFWKYTTNSHGDTINNQPTSTYTLDSILRIIELSFKEAFKLPDLENTLRSHGHHISSARTITEELRRQGKLKLIQFNESNNYSFYALPEWLDENNILKPNYYPNSRLPMKGIESVKVKEIERASI